MSSHSNALAVRDRPLGDRTSALSPPLSSPTMGVKPDRQESDS